MTRTWLLADAVEWIRVVTPLLLDAGYSLALTGGVLQKGASSHDLDVIIYPMQSVPGTDFEGARGVLRSAGLKQTHTTDVLHASWRKKGSLDTKTVEVWMLGRNESMCSS